MAVANSPRAAGNEGPSNHPSVARGLVVVAYSKPIVAATSPATAPINSPTRASALLRRMETAPAMLTLNPPLHSIDHALEVMRTTLQEAATCRMPREWPEKKILRPVGRGSHLAFGS